MLRSVSNGTSGNPRRVCDSESRPLSACLLHGGPQRKTSKKFIHLHLRYSSRQTASESRQSAVPIAGRFGDAVPFLKGRQLREVHGKECVTRLRMQHGVDARIFVAARTCEAI